MGGEESALNCLRQLTSIVHKPTGAERITHILLLFPGGILNVLVLFRVKLKDNVTLLIFQRDLDFFFQMNEQINFLLTKR